MLGSCPISYDFLSLFNKIRVPLIRNEYVYFEMAINPVGGNGVSAYVNDYSTSTLYF